MLKRKWRSLLKFFLGIIALLLLLDFLVVFSFALIKPAINKADAAIILGAAINTPTLYNRTLQGLRLFEQGKVSTLALTGGRASTRTISEAQYMEQVIKRNAKIMPPVVLDQQSTNTYENIKNIQTKLVNADSVVIVSDEFHLARGVLLAKRADFAKVYWSAPEPSYYSYSELVYYYLREMAAMITYLPKFIFG